MIDFEYACENKTLYRGVTEKSFLCFTKFWFEVLQNEPFITNWHHRWIADAIDNIIFNRVDNKNLIVNIPPGGTKTELLSIHLPAFTTALVNSGDLAKFRSLNISFSDSLIRRNSRRTRDIIDSAEFRRFYSGINFGVNQSEEWELVSDDKKTIALTISRSMGSQITGARAGYLGAGYSGHISLDDPDKVEDLFSGTKRERNHRILVGTIRSRRGDKSKENPTPILLIQQRLHVEDSTGFFMSGGMGVEFERISVPALIDERYLDELDVARRAQCWESIKDSPTKILNGIKYRSYWERVESIDQLIKLYEKDEYTFSAQYMQQPIRAGGQLLDTEWLGRYKELPLLRWRAVYVDTNSGKVTDRNDYTVFTLVGYGYDNNLYVIDIERGKYDPQELLERAYKLWSKWGKQEDIRTPMRLRYMSIEDKAAGTGLIETLKKQSGIPVKAQPRGTNQNKLIRHYDCYPQIKSGRVYVPYRHLDDGTPVKQVRYNNGSFAADTEWVVPFLYELSSLTDDILMDKANGYDDQYDTLMDAIDDNLIKQAGNIANWV